MDNREHRPQMHTDSHRLRNLQGSSPGSQRSARDFGLIFICVHQCESVARKVFGFPSACVLAKQPAKADRLSEFSQSLPATEQETAIGRTAETRITATHNEQHDRQPDIEPAADDFARLDHVAELAGDLVITRSSRSSSPRRAWAGA